jgi:hypothetical protein
MKNRILIDESEKRRILGLHKNAILNEDAQSVPEAPLDKIMKKLKPWVQLTQEEIDDIYNYLFNSLPTLKK